MDINGTPLESASISQIHAAMFTGQTTARQLVEAYLERIEDYDQAGPALNAVITKNPHALALADELDRSLKDSGRPVGPLHGIPMVIKDCLETAYMPTSFGSEVFAHYQPGEDAATVASIRAQGAIIVAKTTLPDWATSWFSYSSLSGVTKNPYDLGRDPGGSSSGTGAAVASGYATVGLGTDCGGSVRIPASFCNLVGVRSTPGLISRRGSSPLVNVQDTICPMARSVADAARVFDVMVGFDRRDPLTSAYSIGRGPDSYLASLRPDTLNNTRIGVLRSAFGSHKDPRSRTVNQVMDTALTELTASGARLVDVEIPDLSEWINKTSLYTTKSKYDINQWLASKPDAPMHSVDEIISSGRYHAKLDLLEAIGEGPTDPFSGPDFYPAYVAHEEFMQTVVNLMEDNDISALVYPTTQVVPPTRAETDSEWTIFTFPTNTVIGSQTWMPSITVPAGFTDGGLPIGMEVLTRPYDESTAFKVAYGFEQVIGYWHPPVNTLAN